MKVKKLITSGVLSVYVVILFVFVLLFGTGSYYEVQAGLKFAYIAQADLKLMAIFLPQPLKCWDYRVHHLTWLMFMNLSLLSTFYSKIITFWDLENFRAKK